MNAPAQTEPRGFHILMPPGWARYMVDEEGRKSLVARMTGRMRELSRPDLDAQARTMIDSYWRTLVSKRISAIYLPSDPTEAGPLPLSIAVAQHMATEGTSFEASVRTYAGVDLERFDTPIGTIFRWIKDTRGGGEYEELRSRQIGYAFPLPGHGERRGVLFLSSAPYLDDTDPQALALLTETSDTIMETFRWR